MIGLRDAAFSVGLKVPLSIVFAAIDLYHQFPTPGQKLFFAQGVEVSIAPAAYFVVTQELAKGAHLTFTPRVVAPLLESFGLSGQLSFLVETASTRMFVFATYLHLFGNGLDTFVPISGDVDKMTDFRTDLAIGGLGAF